MAAELAWLLRMRGVVQCLCCGFRCARTPSLIRSGGAQASASPLAESALLLLLALLHHAPAPEHGPGNPFRQAFANMQACATVLCAPRLLIVKVTCLCGG